MKRILFAALAAAGHRVEQTQALFTDNRFHNVGVGINDIQAEVPVLAGEFLKAKATLAEVDVKILGDKRTSELGRFAISRDLIKWCLQQPLEGKPLALDDPKMIALEAYVSHERRGVAMAPGKH